MEVKQYLSSMQTMMIPLSDRGEAKMRIRMKRMKWMKREERRKKKKRRKKMKRWRGIWVTLSSVHQ